MASLTTENVVRTYLKENVTSKDEILDMLCEKMDDFGVESIDDFKDLALIWVLILLISLIWDRFWFQCLRFRRFG